MLKKSLTCLFLVNSLGCASANLVHQASSPGVRSPAQESSSLPTGGRVGLHGMVLVGSRGYYYLEHVPMLSPPHDFQVVALVKLKKADGTEISEDFSQGTFTVLPSLNSDPLKFSLNDFINHHLQIEGYAENTFPAAIYSGDFEQEGSQILSGLDKVLVEIRIVKLARQLPATSERESYTYGQHFTTNLITPDRNYQKITNTDSGTILWCVVGPDFSNPCSK